jgi:hypothetical protein
MLDIPPSTPTRKLFENFVEQLSQLASLECRLFRAELKETSSKLVSAAGLTAGAIILALGGLLTLLAAAALFLVRLRVPPDVACVIVAVVAIAGGGALLLLARHLSMLRPK